MKKIAIIGPSGAGKTTVAKYLAAALNVPLYHLDYYFWQPDWQEGDHDQFMLKQYELVKQDRWIIDGNFSLTLSIRLSEADTIIFLDISRWTCLYRAIKRQIKYYGSNRPEMPTGCISHFDRKYFFFLWDVWGWKTKGGKHVMQYLSLVKKTQSAQVFHFRSQKEIDSFLAERIFLQQTK